MTTTSVIIVTYQSEEFIGPVLDALLSDEGGSDEVIVVDNASTDATREIVDRPGVRLITSPRNLGFAGGCHAGADVATGSTLIFLGHDTVPRKGWSAPLAGTVEDPRIGAAMATIEDADEPGTFNTSGGHLTYFGLAWVSDLGEPIPPHEPDLVDVPFPSGAAMAITKENWVRFDGFRRSLFMYHEDTDLGWCLRLAGLRVVRVPSSRVLHHYDFSRTPEKMYWLERNRHVLLATNYRLPTRIVLAPAFLIADLGVWFVAVRDGWHRQKVAARKNLFDTRALRPFERRRVARIRSVGDATILRTMDWSVSGVRQVSSPRGSGIVDAILGAYLRAALPVVAFFDRRAGFNA